MTKISRDFHQNYAGNLQKYLKSLNVLLLPNIFFTNGGCTLHFAHIHKWLTKDKAKKSAVSGPRLLQIVPAAWCFYFDLGILLDVLLIKWSKTIFKKQTFYYVQFQVNKFKSYFHSLPGCILSYSHTKHLQEQNDTTFEATLWPETGDVFSPRVEACYWEQVGQILSRVRLTITCFD